MTTENKEVAVIDEETTPKAPPEAEQVKAVASEETTSEDSPIAEPTESAADTEETTSEDSPIAEPTESAADTEETTSEDSPIAEPTEQAADTEETTSEDSPVAEPTEQAADTEETTSEDSPVAEPTEQVADTVAPSTESGTDEQPPKIEIDLELPDPSELTPESCVEFLTEKLEESAEKPLRQLKQIVAFLGIKKSLKMLRKAFEIEANGGMMVYNKSRRRTLGGVYFFLAQRWVKREYRVKIWPEMYPSEVTIDWANRQPLVEEALKEVGEASIPRIVLIGRPGRVIEKGKVVLTTMQRKQPPASWPKGLPKMPDNEGPYIVYISAKQWRKVKPSIRNKKDFLIIEGYPTYNAQLNAMTVFAMRTTTKLQDQARREKQKQDSAAKQDQAQAAN